MTTQLQARWDLLLLLSLVLLILMYPVMDHGDITRLLLGALTFAPVILVTIRMSQLKSWILPTFLLMSGSVIVAAVNTFLRNPILTGIKWAILAVFFALSVAALFRYLQNSRAIRSEHLYTAINIYLMMAVQWFALYSAIDVFVPGSFHVSTSLATDRQTELLYFSLVTLSTLGTGNIVALRAEVRMLAALQAIAGVLYIAITVALLVSSYKQQSLSNETVEDK